MPGKSVTYDDVTFSSMESFASHWTHLVYEEAPGPLDEELRGRLKAMLEAWWPRCHQRFGQQELYDFRFSCDHRELGRWQLHASITGVSGHVYIGKKTFRDVGRVLRNCNGVTFAAAAPRRKNAVKAWMRCRTRSGIDQASACASCKATGMQLEADHVVPFEKLADAFAASYPGGYDALHQEQCEVDAARTRGACVEYPAWRDRWDAWHHQRAEMQPLCRQCHYAKSAVEAGLRAEARRQL